MKIVISPAKSLDFDSNAPTKEFTQGIFLEQAEKLSSVLKRKSAKAISKLMHVSDNLGQLNYERNQSWSLPFTLENSKQAIYAFKGDVYIGLDAYSIPEANAYLRQSRAKTYQDIRIGKMTVIKDGRRTYISGRVIAERSS